MKTINLNVLAAPKKTTGLVLYEGPSVLNGKNIVVIATGIRKGSSNLKTGEMVQVWILNADQNPVEAFKAGNDDSVCGDCKHGKMGTCYVNIGQGPYSVFGAYKRGIYTTATPELVAEYMTGRNVRFGAYGDPAAVPFSVFRPILAIAGGHTAYTHQWHNPVAQHCKTFCMASVDNPKEYAKARAAGWRTFRTRLATEPMLPKEFVCPASHEAGKRLSCEDCKACDGADGNPNKGTVTIVIHGTAYKPKRFIAVRQRQIAKRGWQDLIPAHIRNRQAAVA